MDNANNDQKLLVTIINSIQELTSSIKPVLAQFTPYLQEEKDKESPIKIHETLVESDKIYSKTVSNVLDEITPRDSLGWIEGEYKWMSPEIKNMHPGWKKVSMQNGFTIIAGNTVGSSSGEIKSHSHRINGSDAVPAFDTLYYVEGTLGSSYYKYCFPNWHTSNDIKYVSITDSTGSTNNLAAGIIGVLWQYDPNNTFSKTDVIQMN